MRVTYNPQQISYENSGKTSTPLTQRPVCRPRTTIPNSNLLPQRKAKRTCRKIQKRAGTIRKILQTHSNWNSTRFHLLSSKKALSGVLRKCSIRYLTYSSDSGRKESKEKYWNKENSLEKSICNLENLLKRNCARCLLPHSIP